LTQSPWSVIVGRDDGCVDTSLTQGLNHIKDGCGWTSTTGRDRWNQV
jgi:hypothetical protein